ncbi:D-glycerate transporter (predicted), partial [hydrothermal vent metagenome]
NRHYVKYIIAIAAGGAITHTLVPPTPGPLLMAANLNIDVGAMIIVGVLVAIPAAIAGLIFASFMDKRLDIPMRSQSMVDEPEPLPDDQLPSLLMSLLPVLLPVLMISVNTILSTVADAENAARFIATDIKNEKQFHQMLGHPDENHKAICHYLKEILPRENSKELAANLNDVLAKRDLYNPHMFEKVLLPKWKVKQLLKEEATKKEKDSTPPETTLQLLRMQSLHHLLSKNRVRMKVVEVERMNRLLLEISFPDVIQAHTWNTSTRNAANIGALFGNANLALLFSATVAMFVLWQQRKPTLRELAMTVETSLMSGGAIILITAAGGAFGAMLAVANVGSAIQSLFGSTESTGIFYIFLGFGVAALMKIAQGSSTTAMIVVSGMLAAPVAAANLGYHPVYIATAIGGGSLIGSWMNDSGFWIFAKMSGLTEVETLKTWTPLLLILGFVSLVTTLILATLLPDPLVWLS